MLAQQPNGFVVRPLDEAVARQIGRWRYEGPWQVYSPGPGDPLMTTAAGFCVVLGQQDDSLVGFCCSGGQARVPGLNADPAVLDVGWGMNPTLVGQGLGTRFVTAVLDHFRQTQGTKNFRAVVQSWNQRCLKVSVGASFHEVGRLVIPQHGRMVEYVVLTAQFA